MPSTDYSEIDLDFLHTSLIEAGQLAIGQRGQMSAAVKADLTPVTLVDKQVEDFLIEKISARYPRHRILSEEGGVRQQGETYNWVIDPIDGTRAFATGLPIWGVSIGVLRGSEPYVGGFYMPVTGELYSGTRQQAFYNGSPIPRVNEVDMDNVLQFLAVPSSFHLHFTTTYPRVRSLGSTAAQLVYTITGAAVGALSSDFSLWDIAGVLPLLDAVGIELVTLDGAAFQPASLLAGQKSTQPMLAAQPSVIERLLKQISVKR